jgi:pSer/pThr/pTyr-binding forkhead associated (FHA) protein
MRLRFAGPEGKTLSVTLDAGPVTIGRAAEATLRLDDEKVSRLHCVIRVLDGDYVVKDLKSRNGTYVNDARVEVAVLHRGDVIRVGATTLTVDSNAARKGPQTLMREVGQEFERGKGYRTVLREIVESAEPPPPRKAPS